MEEPIVVEVEQIVEPIVETSVPELPEQVYTYQPTDEQGRPLGGKQVIKYKTQEELAKKLVDQNIHLVRALREQTKKSRLGLTDTSDIVSEEAPRFDTPLEFKPRELSPDERIKLSRDLLDPERFEEASTALFEATIGAKPEVLRNTLTRLSQNELSLLAKVESDAFMQMNPDYYPCRENFNILTDWMIKNNLQPVRSNFQRAFDTMRELMVGKPESVVVSVTPEPKVEEIVSDREPILEPVIPEPVVPKNVPPPTGLRDKGSNITPVKKFKYTLADINRMSGDEYKQKLLHEKGFAQIVQALEKEASEKKRNQQY